MAEGHGYKKAQPEDLNMVNLELQLKLDGKNNKQALTLAKSFIFNFTLYKLDFLSKEKVLKREQLENTNIYFFYFAFTAISCEIDKLYQKTNF